MLNIVIAEAYTKYYAKVSTFFPRHRIRNTYVTLQSQCNSDRDLPEFVKNLGDKAKNCF